MKILILKTTYLLLLIIVALYSCDNQSTYSSRNVIATQFIENVQFEYEDGKIIRMTADNHFIYLSSYPDNTVKVFDYNGKLVKTIGQSGEAPWENGSIWSYGQDSTCYWIHDYPKMALKKYDIATDTLLHFQRFITKHNVLYTENNHFVVPYFDDKIGIFYLSLYDALNDTVVNKVNICSLTKRFDTLPSSGDFTFQGNFSRNDDGQSVFFCLYNSSFFFIEKEFKEITHHKDIRNLEISEPIISNDWIHLNPDNAGILAGTMDDKYIYFLAPKYRGSKLDKQLKDFLVDVYDINTKEYLLSFELPNSISKISLIAKTNKGLVVGNYHGNFIVYDNSFVKEIDKIALTKRK